MIDILINEPIAERRQVYFQLVAPDGITPVNSEDGGQPQVSLSGSTFTDVGIGTLHLIGHGRYYAVLDSQTVNSYWIIETRYKSVNTAECPGDSVHVVAYNHNIAPINILPVETKLVQPEFTTINQSIKNIVLPQNSDGTIIFKVEHNYATQPTAFVIHNEAGTILDAWDVDYFTDTLSVNYDHFRTATVYKALYKLWVQVDGINTLLASGAIEIKLAPTNFPP